MNHLRTILEFDSFEKNDNINLIDDCFLEFCDKYHLEIEILIS